MPLPPSSVRELDDDSIALLLKARVDQILDYQTAQSLCDASLEGLCAALYGPGRCGGAGGDADAEQRLWKYACGKMGLAVLPVYPGGPAMPTWRHVFLVLCNELAALEPGHRATYRGLLRGDDAYEDSPYSPDDWDDSEDDDPDEEAPPQRRLRRGVARLWYDAVERGLFCMVYYLLRRVDGIVHFEYGAAIHDASANGDLAIVNLLLAHGADVNAGGDFDGAALGNASYNGHLAVVEVLLAHGANVHANGDAALRLASFYGRVEIVRALLAHGADVHARDDEALQLASRSDHPAVVEALLAAGADVHANADIALLYASGEGHLAVVEVLLAAGANVHARDDAARRLAGKRGHVAVVEVLLAHSADVHADNDEALRDAKRNAKRNDDLASLEALFATGATLEGRDLDPE